jgi:hypothetical protein
MASGIAAGQGRSAIRGEVSTLGPDGLPVRLPGVEILLRCEKATDKPRTTLTDAAGRFSLSRVAPGKCSVTAAAQGFHSETKTVVVTEHSAVELSFQLNLTTVAERRYQS